MPIRVGMTKEISKKDIEIVQSTIPFLKEKGEELTQLFYRRLFKENPEVKEFFNASNQANGAQQQALAGAICAFAQNIETPENLAEAVSRISNKHVSLTVQPEHYPIVGENLLAALNDLLNPAPPEVLQAWGAAYGYLADLMIGAEAKLYEEQKKSEGGWNGFRKMEVFRREKEGQWITSFYLRPVDPCPIIPFRAGQYLTVRVPTLFLVDKKGDEAQTTMRNYSLSGSQDWDHYRISVKREIPHHADIPEGYVSSYLHTRIQVGDVLEIGPPCGDFVLQEHDEETPILLLSGGVGITPLLSMLHAVGPNPTTFLHAAINSEFHALEEEVRELAEQKPNVDVHFRYSAPTIDDLREKNCDSQGLISTEFLSDFITPNIEIYFCGPKPMMMSIMKALRELNHPAEKIHFEFFGPQEELEP